MHSKTAAIFHGLNVFITFSKEPGWQLWLPAYQMPHAFLLS